PALDDPPAAITARDSAEFRTALGADRSAKEREFELKYPAGDPAVEKACRMIAEQVAELKPSFKIKPVAVPANDLWRQIEFNNDYQLAFRHFDYADDWFNPAGLIDPSARVGSGGRNFLGYKPSETFAPLLARCQDRRNFGELRT